MKKIDIALAIFYLLVSQSYGSEAEEFHPGDQIANDLVHSSKTRMLETGVLTQLSLDEFDREGDRIAFGLKEASERNDDVAFSCFMNELNNYAIKYERLVALLKEREEEKENKTP